MPLRRVPLAPFSRPVSCPRRLRAQPGGFCRRLHGMVRLLHLPVFNRNDGCAFRQACRPPLQLSVVRQRSPLAAGCTARPWCHMTVRVVQWFAAAGEREARGEEPGSSIGGSSRGCSMARPLPLWFPITVCCTGARFPRMSKWADFDMRGDSGLGSARLHGSRKCAYLFAALSCRPAAAGLPPADLQLIERTHTPRF